MAKSFKMDDKSSMKTKMAEMSRKFGSSNDKKMVDTKKDAKKTPEKRRPNSLIG